MYTPLRGLGEVRVSISSSSSSSSTRHTPSWPLLDGKRLTMRHRDHLFRRWHVTDCRKRPGAMLRHCHVKLTAEAHRSNFRETRRYGDYLVNNKSTNNDSNFEFQKSKTYATIDTSFIFFILDLHYYIGCHLVVIGSLFRMFSGQSVYCDNWTIKWDSKLSKHLFFEEVFEERSIDGQLIVIFCITDAYWRSELQHISWKLGWTPRTVRVTGWWRDTVLQPFPAVCYHFVFFYMSRFKTSPLCVVWFVLITLFYTTKRFRID